jgi:hypothetical protein
VVLLGTACGIHENLGNTHTHKHTLKSIVFWNLFGNTKKTQKKESSAGKGVIKRVNGPLTTDSQKIQKNQSRLTTTTVPKTIPKNWSKNLP